MIYECLQTLTFCLYFIIPNRRHLKSFLETTIPEILLLSVVPADIYLFKVSDGNTKTICEIWSKLITKIPKHHSGVLILNLLNKCHTLSSGASIVHHEKVTFSWAYCSFIHSFQDSYRAFLQKEKLDLIYLHTFTMFQKKKAKKKNKKTEILQKNEEFLELAFLAA